MKRVGQLMPRMVDADNLRRAFRLAVRGKRQRPEVRAYARDLAGNLARMREQLLRDEFPFGGYMSFTIWDPKQRTIHAPGFEERIAHHAIMNVCEPIFDRHAIADTYACRRGKGRLAAIRRAESFCASRTWFLKMDIRRYFPSIDHEVLLACLSNKIKDPDLLRMFRRIVAEYYTEPGRGLPIGALTSQHFANFYLAPLDRFAKEHLRFDAFVRYMDDFVIWSDDKSRLKRALQAIRQFLADRLRLELKPVPFINRTAHGMDFLGYRLYPGRTCLTKRNRLRLRRRLGRYATAWETGELSDRALQERLTALTAFVDGTGSPTERKRVFDEGNKGGVQAA
jgi:RNA-directed DNA polymerase